jgi:signal transduction histidine kinase
LQEVELHVVLPKERIFVEADSKQLRQVLLNLLLNALDAVESQGLIEVVLGADAPSEGPTKVPAAAGPMQSEHDALRLASQQNVARAAPMFSITLLDTGPGFPPDILPRVFEPFVTTKDTGTGLGLSICRQIIAAHGGTIRARNRIVRGACFEIQLPTSVEPAVAPTDRSVSASAPNNAAALA